MNCKTLLLSLVFGAFFALSGQAQVNMTLIGELDFQALHGSNVSDIWGYTDEDGNEYALVGVNNGGVSVVDISDPVNPMEIFFFPGPPSTWRDLKVWDDYAYITTEGGGGLVIIDLSPLPQSTALNAISFQGDNWESAHNLFIDEFGICYIFGADRGNGGAIFLDLTVDPMNPVEVGEFDQWYIHDGMARGDTLYAAHISNGFFSIVDVADKTIPVVLGTQNTGNNFTHNIWVSDDGDFVFTTDEVSGGFLGSYDISDPTDIQEIDLTQSDPGSGTVPHNTHVIGDFIFTSYYRYGATVHDVSRPQNVIETGNFDTAPALVGNGFNGSWGAYPYFPSGIGAVSDIEDGLVLLDVVYVHACWLEGLVTDAVTSSPIQDAEVDIVAANVQDLSALDGTYATGFHTAGLYDVTFSKPGYQPQTITGVQLTNNVVTMLDVQLQPLMSFALAGGVIESGSAAGVPNPVVSLVSTDFTFNVTGDAQGNFNLTSVFEGTYDIAVGAWGWQTVCQTGVVIDQNTPPLSFTLDPGFADDFAVDLGWVTTSNGATSGFWERAEPDGTSFQGSFSNPDVDVNGDCFDQAYVTGNGGGGAGNDDVDDGGVTLISPIMDLTGLVSPRINYFRWFFNAGGQGNPNDEMVISITNGTDTAVVETLDINSMMSAWIQAPEVIVGDHLAPTATVQFIVTVTDMDPGHITEGGIDIFEVSEGPASVGDLASSVDIRVFPNPVDGPFTVTWSSTTQVASLQIFDVQGRLIQSLAVQGNSFEGPELNTGAYQLVLTDQAGNRFTKPIIVQ